MPYVGIDETDLTPYVHDSMKPLGGDLKISSIRIPGSDRFHSRHDGREPKGWELKLQSYSPKSTTPAEDLEAILAVVDGAAEDSKFFPYTSDRFARIAVAGAWEDTDNQQVADYWAAKLKIWATMNCLFDHPAEAWEPALGDLYSLAPEGSIAAPLDLLEISGTYSGGSHLTDLILNIWDDAESEIIDSVTLSDRLLSDEGFILDYRGIIRQVYEDDFTDGTRFGQDAVNDGGSVGSGVLALGNEGSAYWQLKGPWPLRKNLVVQADIVISAGSPVLQYSFDGITWTTAYEGTELTETNRWTIPNTAGRKEVYVRFKSQSDDFATRTTTLGSNRDISYTARKSGTDGNAISITYVKPGSTTALSVAVVGNAITVTLSTSGSTCTTYCYQVMDLLWTDLAVLELLGNIQPAPGSDTTGLMVAMSQTYFAGATVSASMTLDNLRIEQERRIPESDLPVIPIDDTYKVEIDGSAGGATISCEYRDRFRMGGPGGAIAMSANIIYGEEPSGSGTSLTLLHIPAGGLDLYKNGVHLTPGAGNDYTLSGNTITLAEAKVAGDVFSASYAY